MTLTRKDALATAVTILAVLAFAATYEAWDVWLIGSSHRWAAAAITLLGVVGCALGSAGDEMSKGKRMTTTTKLLSAVGMAAGVFAVWAIATGSLTPLWLLVACTVILWAGSTLRHVRYPGHRALTT